MNKVYIIVLFLISSIFIFASPTQAQSCGGTGSCCTSSTLNYPPGCTSTSCATRVCTVPIQNGLACTYAMAGGCGIYDCFGEGWVTSSSCFLISTPPPTSPPTSPPGGGGGGGGYGACGSCNTCSGGNASQCRTDPGGVCVWDPSGCAGNTPPPAPFGCTVGRVLVRDSLGATNYGPYNISDRVTACAAANNADGLVSRINVRTQDNSVITYNGNRTANVGDPNYPYLVSGTRYCPGPAGTAVGNGTTRLSITVFGKRCPACSEEVMCTGRTQPITVGAPPPACTQPTVTATPQCSLSSGGNAQVTFQWNYVANADLYNFYVVDRGTGNTISGTDTGFVPGNSSTFNFCNGIGSTCTHVVSLPEGTTDYEGRVIARSTAGTCSDSVYSPSNNFSVALCAADAWWQAGDGDIITQGDIISSIPSSILTPENNIALDGSGGFPGIIMTGPGDLVDAGSGNVSTKRWLAQTPFLGRVPTYADFVSLIPASITPQNPTGGSSVAGSYFRNGGPTDSSGYTWYVHNGDLTISSDIDLTTAGANRSVILFVRGNLTFSGKVTLNPKTQFFMAIVGKTAGNAGGDISINPTVSTTGTTPTLTGIFYCEGRFRTGTTGAASDGKLNVQGSVAALGGVNLQRDLGVAGNLTDPSEVFGISLDLFLKYPSALTFKRPIWQEVAP